MGLNAADDLGNSQRAGRRRPPPPNTPTGAHRRWRNVPLARPAKPPLDEIPSPPAVTTRPTATDKQATVEQRGIVAELFNGSGKENERTIQANIGHLLKTSGLFAKIAHEARIGDGRRIDIEADFLLVEVKRELRGGNRLPRAVDQVCGYVAARNRQRGVGHIGVVTDGVEWRAYCERGGQFVELGAHTVKGSSGTGHATRLLSWLRQLVVNRQRLVVAGRAPAQEGKVLPVLVCLVFGVCFVAAGSGWIVVGVVLILMAILMIFAPSNQ